MKTLAELCPERLSAYTQITLTGLCLDSRQVVAGNVLLLRQGGSTSEQLQQFADHAVARGAVAIVSDIPLSGSELAIPVLHWPDLSDWVGVLAQRWYADPQIDALRVLAVTGTNGKTTISRLMAELLSLNQHPCAVMGTTGNGILPNLAPSSHTTLDALSLQQHLRDYAKQGAQFACLEASSHGLDQGRLVGTPIEVAVFSNLSRDHLDYHGTLAAYLAAKAKLFHFPSLHTAILNADDPASAQLSAQLPPQVRVWSYSTQQPTADFAVLSADYQVTGATLQIRTPAGDVQLHSPLLGHFNVSNLLAAIAAVYAVGVPMADLVRQVPNLVGAAGRMQVIPDTERLLVVDYAHTPDALVQVLSSLRPHVQGQLWVVFGCGGDRDRGKRPLMTQAALAHADQLILTADNPRRESVEAILDDMQQDLSEADSSKICVQPDRRQAIRQALHLSQAGDAVVLAGKGHEDYQEIQGVRHWFDDVVELRQARIELLDVSATRDAMSEQALDR
ncbi:MAG: UDP-N-acetylmuramoyl-L-alanyl-D-glutamate--2,6-diaminopimelate ligase [Pseudomonadota bacterium]|nr:UDP-N-acetylmuramoyl-L-alanyl-D-glutamate--2,6-diaminopimelate ligase [Pseudomonadota bacterium]